MEFRPTKDKNLIVHLLRKISYQLHGLRDSVKASGTIRVFLPCVIAGILFLGIIMNFRAMEWIALMFTLIIVVIVEIVNTAIERICDLITKEFDERVRLIKDLAAAAVFICHLLTSALFVIFSICHLVKFDWIEFLIQS